jgi:hypothetical protein
MRLSLSLRALACSFFVFLCTFSAGGQSASLSSSLKLSLQDSETLAKGGVLIREVRSYRDLSLTAEGASAEALRAKISELRPNYLSEVIAVIPARGDLIEKLSGALGDVKGYVGIRYWSKRQQTYYDLFDKMEILSKKSVPDGVDIEVLQHMEPFSEYICRYSYRLAQSTLGAGEELFFSSENVGKISYSYQGIDAVSPGHMTWMPYAFPSGDSLVFYGVGAVKAFDMFGVIRDRLKTSFLGRIESFFGAMIGKMKA